MASLSDQSLKYKVAMDLIPGIGGVLARKLIEAAGSPEEVFSMGTEGLRNIRGIGKSLASIIVRPDILEKAERELEFIARYGIDALYYRDDDYPERLRECPDAPIVLFRKGDDCLDASRTLSLVGTRSASRYGIEFCEYLVTKLAVRGHDPVIISGLAYGIDITAHKTALEHGLKTVAVLAHGLATVYPSVHRKYAGMISRQGALVTDFGSNVRPERGNFLKRNRIIAGLADATVVIESSEKGGALITADFANSYNRDVFALPGRVTDKMSQGCNDLIKTNRALLIEKVEDLEYIMGWKPENVSSVSADPDYINMSDPERLIVSILRDAGELSADRISEKTGHSSSNTALYLLNLECAGFIASLPGRVYRLTDRVYYRLR